MRLYEKFTASQAKILIEEVSTAEEQPQEKANHIFQALQYLRKLCNHPLLVLNPKHPDYTTIMKEFNNDETLLHELEFCPKLMALK
jgi:TATA-binding protein-associated factor